LDTLACRAASRYRTSPGRPAGLHRCPPGSKAKITYIDSAGSARTVDAEVGATVMETALKHGVPGIEAECGGACACATCHVYVDEAWREKTGEPSPMEEDMLDFGYDVRPNSRLSCQIKVTEDLDGLVVSVPERQT
jgi:2Fe-2S ferredoxin